MRVLLTKDVENVGRAGDVKEVADGYGRNFLLRRKLAVAAGKGAEAEARRLREAALKAQRSIWDRDVRDTVAIARHGVSRLFSRIRSRVRHRDDYESMSEVG